MKINCAALSFTTGLTLNMKNPFLMGIIVLAYGMSSPVFASDTATLTISGSVTTPTCHADVVDTQLQQRCGNNTYLANAGETASMPVRGVVTEVITLPGSTARQIVLNRYD
ncbi:hypothetical protein HMPREF3207_03903 [Citrobacter koseri]|nr:hypothetical protein HMPREF3207_03903 [Citrobacter koseri]